MNESRLGVIGLSLLFTACGRLTALSPTSPSPMSSAPVSSLETSIAPGSGSRTPAPTHAVGPDVPSGLVPLQRVITGTVGPLASYPGPCYVERYPCEKYR